MSDASLIFHFFRFHVTDFSFIRTPPSPVSDAGAAVPVGAGRARHAGRAHDHRQDIDPAGAYAKKKTIYAPEQKRSDVAQEQAQWVCVQAMPSSQRLIFLDETWATTNMMPSWGRSLRGERCLGYAPGAGTGTPQRLSARSLTTSGSGRADQWRCICGLGGAVSGTPTARGRHRGDGQPQSVFTISARTRSQA